MNTNIFILDIPDIMSDLISLKKNPNLPWMDIDAVISQVVDVLYNDTNLLQKITWLCENMVEGDFLYSNVCLNEDYKRIIYRVIYDLCTQLAAMFRNLKMYNLNNNLEYTFIKVSDHNESNLQLHYRSA